ncbi:MAG: hypothetical protein JXJ22_10240 [Bacteroidales bacterium]|nr:hypothetical protein [Bacteroidales bacterium]
MSSAFLYISQKLNKKLYNEFIKLSDSVKTWGDACVLYDESREKFPDKYNIDHFDFTFNGLRALQLPMEGTSLVPGYTHFPLIAYYKENPNHDYYWYIENDIRFSGEWKDFFSFFQKFDYDFISTHLRDFDEEPDWKWWKIMHHPGKNIPDNSWVRSFNTIYRLSNKAIEFLEKELKSGWIGHDEGLIVTLLKINGFSILDFGGNGRYVLDECINKYYTGNIELNAGTMRYRPPFLNFGKEKNKLYHPIKGFRLFIKYYYNYYTDKFMKIINK